MGIDYDTDTAQERMEAVMTPAEKLIAYFRGLIWFSPREGQELVHRLRARQREEGSRERQAYVAGYHQGVNDGESGEVAPPGELYEEADDFAANVPDHDATPQREGEREPTCPDCGGRLALVTGEYRLASGELVGRSDWYKCPECSEGDPDDALRAALDTEPPAEPDLDELTPRCPVCEETMHDCECNPYMDTGGDDG